MKKFKASQSSRGEFTMPAKAGRITTWIVGEFTINGISGFWL